jgi:hypothetical protein
VTTAVVVTTEWELEAVRRAAAAGAFEDDAPVLLVVATLDAVPEVRDSLVELQEPAGRACFDEVHDLNALVAPQHPAAWGERDLAAGADRVRAALGSVDRVVRPAGAPLPPVLPLLVPAARQVLLAGDALDLALVRAGVLPAHDEVLAPVDLPLGGATDSAARTVRWTAPDRTDERALDVAVARLLVAPGPGRTTSGVRGDAAGGAPASHDEADELLAAVGVLAAARHGLPAEPSAVAIARAAARLRAAARRPGLEALAGWSANAVRRARRRRATAARATLVVRVRRVRGAVRRRVERLLRRVWERRVLARAARDVRDPAVVAASTRRAQR